ncbi:MAG: DNA/RNA non-specific endonuclease [Terracidiphilus sp.]
MTLRTQHFAIRRLPLWASLAGLFFFVIALWAVSCGMHPVYAQCPQIPVPAVAGAEKICHQAYVSLYDANFKVPRLVAYELTGPHTLGCIPRASGFHSEGDSAKPAEYEGSGYDLGHMDPAQDNAWDEAVSHDSFSMFNIAPQLPGLNRQEWERLEEDVRAWAEQRGDLLVYVGLLLQEQPKRLGDIAVPTAFFKIVVDRKTGEVLAFQMPQAAIDKGDVTPWLVTVKSIEKETGIHFGLGESATAPWPADIEGWHKAHKEACGK